MVLEKIKIKLRTKWSFIGENLRNTALAPWLEFCCLTLTSRHNNKTSRHLIAPVCETCVRRVWRAISSLSLVNNLNYFTCSHSNHVVVVHAVSCKGLALVFPVSSTPHPLSQFRVKSKVKPGENEISHIVHSSGERSQPRWASSHLCHHVKSVTWGQWVKSLLTYGSSSVYLFEHCAPLDEDILFAF